MGFCNSFLSFVPLLSTVAAISALSKYDFEASEHHSDALTAAVPSSYTQTTTTTTPPPPSIAPTSYSFAYTVTTPTTIWTAPSFTAAVPMPKCSDTMCPAINGGKCVDADGMIYGIICDTFFSGLQIVDSGKMMLMERTRRGVPGVAAAADVKLGKREYAGDINICSDFCNWYNDIDNTSPCAGFSYAGGYCMAYDTVTGTFNDTGHIAALRQSP